MAVETVSLVALAEEAKTALAAQTFERLGNTIVGYGGTVERKYVSRIQMDDPKLRYPCVNIVPQGEDIRQKARVGAWEHDPGIGVSLTQRVDVATEVAVCDALMGLGQDIADWFKTWQPSTVQAWVHEIRMDVAFEFAELDEKGIFESWMLVTFRMGR